MPPIWSPRGSWGAAQRWVRLGGAPARLHEGLFVAGVSAGRRSPVDCVLGCVACGCPAFGLRVGLRWALCQCLPGRCVPRCAHVAAVCWGRGWGGARVTRGLCPVGGWWWGVGGMAGARRRSPRASVWCLAAFACRHVRRAIGWRAGVLVARLARDPARYLRSGWSPGV